MNRISWFLSGCRMNHAARLSDLLHTEKTLLAPGAHDPLAALPARCTLISYPIDRG